jgi:hypothetical protein
MTIVNDGQMQARLKFKGCCCAGGKVAIAAHITGSLVVARAEGQDKISLNSLGL